MRNGAIALAAALAAGLGAVLTTAETGSAREGIALPAPVLDQAAGPGREVAVLAGGCFWGIQGVFQHLKGVESAVSGYAGGAADTATYGEVGSGQTGHAESVEITFDPAKVSYGQILQVFLASHDPTERDRQGPDVGPQYRSAIFPRSPEQAKVAAAYIDQLDAAKIYPEKLATTVERGAEFYPAEGYHQNYLTLNPTQPYIVANDLPKIENLERLFPQLYRPSPVLVPEEMLN